MKEIDNKVFRKALRQFPYISESSGSYLFDIVSVKAFERKNLPILVEIETHRPGILIGKAGWQVNGIKKLMEWYCKREVEISLKECNLFNDLY